MKLCTIKSLLALLWLVLCSASMSVSAAGLKPGESLNVVSVSDGESLTSSPNARQDGSYGVTLFPAVEGKASGKVTLSVKSSRCRLKVTFPWQS